MSNLRESLLRQYPIGTRVELVRMIDPYTKLWPGDQGTVEVVDDLGTVHVVWDRGWHLGVLYGIDMIRKVEAQ